MTRIAVMGASGFVARHLIPLLLEDGHEVRGLARSAPEGVWERTAPGFTFMPGDIRQDGLAASVMAGCDVLIHASSSFIAEDDPESVIVDGGERVLQAAKDAGIQRLIFLSCLGADASSPSPYYVAKWRAEAALRGSGLPFTILRPSLVVGRGDGVLRPLAELIRGLPVVPVPGHGEHRLQPIDVVDLAQCIRSTVNDDIGKNETIAIGGPMFITLRQLIDLLYGELGVVKPKMLVPRRLLPAVSHLIPARARSLYREPRVAQFEHGVVASPGIVQRTFGFQAASILPRLSGYIA